jgi:hypothetical protein
MSSSIIKMYHTCGISGVKGYLGEGSKGEKWGLWEWGSWFSAWDWCGWKFVSSHKGLLPKWFHPFTFITTPVLNAYMCYKNACNINLFFPLQVKNKPHDELQNMRSFLGSLVYHSLNQDKFNGHRLLNISFLNGRWAYCLKANVDINLHNVTDGRSEIRSSRESWRCYFPSHNLSSFLRKIILKTYLAFYTKLLTFYSTNNW